MKQISPTVSIIVSFYNCEQYITSAVESVLEQTFGDFECIIIDDASSDGSQKILEKLAEKDTRIQYIRNPINKGKAYNCNLWISLAKGKYIALMDGDDIALPKRLEKQVSFLEHHSDIDIVGTNQTLIDEDGAVIGEVIKPTSTEDITKYAFLFQAMNHPTIMARQSLFVNMRYREEYSEFEDADLFMRIFLAGYKWYNLPEKLYLYRIHSWNVNNKSTRWKALRYFQCQKDIIQTYSYVPSLKERVFMYGYLITGFLLNFNQQRSLQRYIKESFFQKNW